MVMNHFLALFMESAPWLLLGLILAGMLKVFVPMSWMQKQLGGHGIKATLKAALLGAPLPLCSCGVIPAAVGLRRSGASKAATTSFLVSTPETGVDSVTVSYVLLGPFMAIVRPIAAVTSAIVAGLLVGRDEHQSDAAEKSSPMTFKPMTETPKLVTPKQSSCCSSKAEPKTSSCCSPSSHQATQSCCSETVESTSASCCSSGTSEISSCCSAPHETSPVERCCSTASAASDSCCSSSKSSCCGDGDATLENAGIGAKLWQGLKYAATDLIADTAIWLLVGLFFAALVQSYIPSDFLATWGDGVLAMLVMVIVSIPMYICATASTPIAAGLLLAGVSPGAVLVFMLAGPATNIATLGVVAKEMGRRALFGYLGGVLSVALVSGVLVNYLVAHFGFEVVPQLGEEHRVLPDAVVNYSAIILAVLMGKVLYDKLPSKAARRDCCS